MLPRRSEREAASTRTCRSTHYDPEAELMLLHFGPQHPSTHGVFRMDLYLDGEIIVKATPYVGYLHRAVEKLCEKLTYVQQTPVVDKNDYVAPMTNEQAHQHGLREAARARGAAARALDAHALRRAAARRLAPAGLGTFALDLGGALGGGSTRVHVLLPRARADPRPLRGGDRRALPLQHAHHRRKPPRHARGLGGEGPLGARRHRVAHRRVRGAELDNRIFQMRTEGRRRARRRAGARARRHRPQPARLGVDHDLRRDAPFTPTTRSR
jgi:hypothetical protein